MNVPMFASALFRAITLASAQHGRSTHMYLAIVSQSMRRMSARGEARSEARRTLGIGPAAAAVAVRGARRTAQVVVLLHERRPEPIVVAAGRTCASIVCAGVHRVWLAVDVFGADELRGALDADCDSGVNANNLNIIPWGLHSGSLTAGAVTLGTVAAPTKEAEKKRAAIGRNFIIQSGGVYWEKLGGRDRGH